MTDKKSPKKKTTEEMMKAIGGILKNGMFLGEMTEAESKKLETNLIDHLTSSPFYNAYHDNETGTIMVETTFFDPLICIDVTNDSIYFLPLNDKTYYQPFMKVIEYLLLDNKRKKAEMQKKLEQEEQDNTEEIKQEEKVKPNFDFL